MGQSMIMFNGRSSLDYGIVVETPPNYEIAERDYDIIHVPGRSGDLSFDSGSYKNVNREYQIAFGSYDKDFIEMANKVPEWLHSVSGYARLEDSYEPEYYKIAMYNESLDVQNILRHAGRVTISFNRKPQRFLKLGDQFVVFNTNGVLRNPTNFKSEPIITIRGTGSGQVKIGDYICMISNIGTFTVLDCDVKNAYKNTENRNQYITLPDGFPKLIHGDNEISFSGGVTSVEVIPKWWTI